MLETTSQLVEVACGRQYADLYIENGRVLNVYSGELLTGHGVAISAGRIAYVGPARGMIGPDTRIVNAEDGILVPGYIDPHAHFDCYGSLKSLADALLPLGTTALINDTLAIVARYGAKGLSYLQQAAENLPLHVYFTVPASGWAPELEEQGYPAGLSLSNDELAQALMDERVVGTSEFLPWRRLIKGDNQLLAKLELAKHAGKRCEGHCPGAKADQIQALAAAGITDCHEAIQADEALDRLRAGMYVLLRHGPARSDLPALAPLALRDGIDRSRLMLTPDWLPPEDLVKFGHMNHLITSAMELGIPAIEAYRMATLNPARYHQIEEHVGAIAPGRIADILCLESLSQPLPSRVIAAGKLVAKEGEILPGAIPGDTEPDLPRYRPPILQAQAEDFRVSSGQREKALVPAIEIIDRTITRRQDLLLPVRDGAVELEAGERQILKMAVPHPEGGFSLGFLVGVEAPLGGLCSSMASEPFHTLVIGNSDHDMALAYNRMVELGGGMIAAQQGRIEVELPLPVGGFISTAPIPQIAAAIDNLKLWSTELGCPLENLFLTHHFLTYVGVPFYRMTPWGIYDVKEQVFLPSLLN